ATYFCARWILY
nr:immunoglobulin heavy chain junction region [Mus musculus]